MSTIQFSRSFRGNVSITKAEENAISSAIAQRFNGKQDRITSDNLVVNTEKKQYIGHFSKGLFEVKQVTALAKTDEKEGEKENKTGQNLKQNNLETLLGTGQIVRKGGWYAFNGKNYNGKKAILQAIKEAK